MRRAGFVSLLGLATLSQACGGTPTFDEPAAAPVQAAPTPTLAPPSMVDPRATLSPRPTAESVAVDLGAIPTIDVTPGTLGTSSKPVPARSLRVEPIGESTVSISVPSDSRVLGLVHHEGSSGRSLTISCPKAGASTIEWNTLTLDANGDARYRVGVGVIDPRCRALFVREEAVQVQALVGGVGWVVRRCDGGCTPTTPLTVLTPALVRERADELGTSLGRGSGDFGLVDLPVRRGSAASFEASVDLRALQVLSHREPSSDPSRTLARIGIDVSQSSTEAAAIIVAYYTEEAAPPDERRASPSSSDVQIDF